MNVSYIIPAFNEAEGILDTLSSIRKYHPVDVSDSYEIIVVDNGSTDETPVLVKNFGAKLINKPEGSIASLRNSGVSNSTGDALVFLDADVLLTESWQKNISQVLRDVISSNLVTGSTTYPPDNHNVFHRYWFKEKAKKGSRNYIGSAHLITSRKLFDSLGGFDETLETSEDFDFCQRALQRGYKLQNDSRLIVVHLGYPETVFAFIKREKWHGKSDCKSINAMLHSKSFIVSIAFVLCLIVSTIFLAFGSLYLSLLLIIAALFIAIISSFIQYRRSGSKVIFINSGIYVFYFIGRVLSFI